MKSSPRSNAQWKGQSIEQCAYCVQNTLTFAQDHMWRIHKQTETTSEEEKGRLEWKENFYIPYDAWGIFKTMCIYFFLSFFFFFSPLVFLGLRPWHMEFPRLGVGSELKLLACTTATATPDPSQVCVLHHSSWQHWILNPLGSNPQPQGQ